MEDIERGRNRPRTPKAGWVTRRIPTDFVFEFAPLGRPAVGDLLLCEIVRPSLHSRLELTTGERAKLYAGDLIICALGSRYATSLLEGTAEIDGERADLLSASGICGRVLERSDKALEPTTLKVLAQAADGDKALNLRRFALGAASPAGDEPAWLLAVGSAMDSGKTTACATLINSFARAGLRVGAAKLTGTAGARDLHAFRDAGAGPTLDFLDCGWPSTAGCSIVELRRIARALFAELRSARVDVAVLEVADGLLQPETMALLEDVQKRLTDPTVVLTARESLAGVAGAERLSALGYRVGAVSGVLTSSPLACREVERGADVPCIPTNELGRHALALAGFAEPRVSRQAPATTA